MSTIAQNNAIPDYYSWHQIGDWEREPDRTIPDFNTMKGKYKLPDRPIHINEYASKDEQNPGTTPFFIGQLERYNLQGLRSNWGGGGDLHNWMANLIWKNGNTYYPNGEWVLYKYYANMVGDRVATTAATDRKFDAFAVKTSNSTAKIIAGTRLVKARYDIQLLSLSSLGLPASGSLSIRTYRFDWNGPTGQVTAPVDLGKSTATYSGNTVSVPSRNHR